MNDIDMPWSVSREPDYATEASEQLSPGLYYVNSQHYCLASGIVRETDAILMAAAPDLLVALRTLVEECSSTRFLGIRPQSLESARAAIAKAEGK